MTTQSNKNLCDYVMKSDISEHHVDILSNLFACLSLANQMGVETDHSSDNPNVMTLDVDQVRHEMREYRHKLITNMEIIDALSDLHAPRLLPNSVNISRQGNGGHRIMPVRLDYGQVAEKSPLHVSETDKLAEELSQVNFIESAATSSKWETDAKAWKNKAFKLYEQQTIDRDTIQSLRAVIIDMAETLHVADPIARIGMTSSDLLDLINSQNDMSDNAF